MTLLQRFMSGEMCQHKRHLGCWKPPGWRESLGLDRLGVGRPVLAGRLPGRFWTLGVAQVIVRGQDDILFQPIFLPGEGTCLK
jgi:hypothetical protein